MSLQTSQTSRKFQTAKRPRLIRGTFGLCVCVCVCACVRVCVHVSVCVGVWGGVWVYVCVFYLRYPRVVKGLNALPPEDRLLKFLVDNSSDSQETVQCANCD